MIEFPLVMFCAGTITPVPLASVSTRTWVASAAMTVSVCRAEVRTGTPMAELVRVGVPAKVSR